MTTTINITHTEAIELFNELSTILADKNLDNLTIVIENKNIHIIKTQENGFKYND